MEQSMGTASHSQPLSDDQHRAKRVRRFTIGVSLVLIIICNAIVLVGLWASGINLDELAATPDVFNSKQDICLRLGWRSVTGAAEPVPLCSEWIHLSDPSGKTHQLQREIKFRQGPDGQYYVDQGRQADYRLLIMVLVVVVVIAFGLVAKWYLVGWYRLRLESAAGHGASLVH
jgi:predicted nucleic acid-binding Zn ribbon protein